MRMIAALLVGCLVVSVDAQQQTLECKGASCFGEGATSAVEMLPPRPAPATAVTAAPGSPVLLKARIVQLESQVKTLLTENALLKAQVLMAQRPKDLDDDKAARAAVEKDAGCAINWNVTPPVCPDGVSR